MSNLDDVTFVVQKAGAVGPDDASRLRLPADIRSPTRPVLRRKRRTNNATGSASCSASSSGGDNDDADNNNELESNATEEDGSLFEDSDEGDWADDMMPFDFDDDDDFDEDEAGEGFGSYNTKFRKKTLPGGQQTVLWDSAAAVMSEPPSGLRTWDGVFLPVLLNILGVVVFIKLPYVLAQTGLLLFWGVLLICYVVSGLATISIAALSTNGHVGEGGPYHMASRVLGAGVGLAVGCSFVVGTIVNGAFFITGSSHFAVKMTHVKSMEDWSNDSVYLATITVASIQLLLLLAVALTGLSRAFRILSVVLIAVAIIDIFVVCGQSKRNVGEHGFTGFSWATLENNLWPKFSSGDSNFNTEGAIAVIFPSVGGILSGITLSGEIRHAGKALPRGIGYAWIVSVIIYVLVSFVVAGAFDRAVLATKQRDSLMDAMDAWAFCPGAFCACFAAALANIVGCSRVIFAMAGDELIPGVRLFRWVKSFSKDQCVILCWLITQVAVLAIGQNYTAASVVGSLVILSCYVALSLGCFLASVSGVISYRPTYNLFSDKSSLLGAFLSFILMFLIHPLGAAAVIFLHFSSQFAFAANMDPTAVHWGDASQPLTFFFVRKLLLNLDERREHMRHWRPSLLHLVTDFHLSQNLIGLANNMKKGGLLYFLHALKGEFGDTQSPCHWMKRWTMEMINQSGMKAFASITFGQRLRPVLQQVIRAAGLGAFRPNSILLSLDELMDAPMHKAGLRTPSAAELAIFAGSSSKAAALFRGVVGSEAVLTGQLSTLSDMGIRPSPTSGLQRRESDIRGEDMPASSSAAVNQGAAAAAAIMRRASKLLTQPESLSASKLRASLESWAGSDGASFMSRQEMVETLSAQRDAFTTSSFAHQQPDNNNNDGDEVTRQQQSAPAVLAGNINASVVGLPTPPATPPQASAAAAAAASSSGASNSSPAEGRMDSPSSIPASPSAPSVFPSQEPTARFCATLNEDLGNEAKLQVLLENLRLYRELANHTASADGISYADEMEFASIAHDITKLHLNLFVARNMWKLDGVKIRTQGDAKESSSDDDDDEEKLMRTQREEEEQACCSCCDDDKKSKNKGRNRAFYIDLISPDPGDAIVFLSAFCLSKTAVWKTGARLRVIDFVPTSLDVEDAANARRQMLKLKRITAEVRVIALDSLPPAAHRAVDAILEADIVHHQQRMAAMTMMRRTMTAGGGGMSRTGTMNRSASTKWKSAFKAALAASKLSGLTQPPMSPSAAASPGRADRGFRLQNTASGLDLQSEERGMSPMKRAASSNLGGSSSMESPLLSNSGAPMLLSPSAIFPSLTLRRPSSPNNNNKDPMRNSDMESVGTQCSSRASDIGYIRRVLASSRKRSQLVNAIYKNYPALTERTGIILARVPAFPMSSSGAATTTATAGVTENAAKQWMKDLKTISDGMPPMMMCCGEGPLASSDDW